MAITTETAEEFREYGTAIGIALSDSLRKEAVNLAFTNGSSIKVDERKPASLDLANSASGQLPNKVSIDNDGDGKADMALTYERNDRIRTRLTNISIDSNLDGKPDGSSEVIQGNMGHMTGVNIDADNDYVFDTKVKFGDRDVSVDSDGDGKPDILLIPDLYNGNNWAMPSKGMRVDLGADGTIDGYAEFVRNEGMEIEQIKFRKV